MWFDKFHRICSWQLMISVFVLTCGCAQTELVVHAAKELKNEIKKQLPKKITGKSQYKIGNPYQIEGIWYYPKVNYSYNETGVASWYGKKFHGKPTANGEIFDMNSVSAAHRTLPLPSIVQVVNLKNGRAIKVRVNDRGPFARGRILDLSRRAAQLLGFERQGTAPVRVRILSDESIRLANSLSGSLKPLVADDHPVPDAAPRAAVYSAELPAPKNLKTGAEANKKHQKLKSTPIKNNSVSFDESEDGVIIALTPVHKDPKMYIQAGAFIQFENANRLRAVLSPIGSIQITQIRITGRPLFRVRLGPLNNLEEADDALAAVVKAGYPDSRLIID